MNPYMELPKLNQPAHTLAPSSANLDQQISASAYRAVSAVEALGNAVRRFFEARRQRREVRAAVAELSSLNDRTLKDIGIDRSEIRSVVEKTQRAEAAGNAAPAPRAERVVRGRPNRPNAVNDNGRVVEAA